MEQLGIEPKLLIAQIINFSIIIFVLSKLLYKPILEMLEKRKKKIEEGLAITEKLEKEEAKLKEKGEKIAEEAHREGRKIVDDAKKQGKLAEKTIVETAHKEAEDIIAKGKLEVEREREAMEKDVKKQTVLLATAMAKRMLSGVLSEVDQHALLSKQLKELETKSETSKE